MSYEMRLRSFELLVVEKQSHSTKAFRDNYSGSFIYVAAKAQCKIFLALNFEILDGKINTEVTTGLWMFENPSRGHEPNME